jgi:hypothetical protein
MMIIGGCLKSNLIAISNFIMRVTFNLVLIAGKEMENLASMMRENLLFTFVVVVKFYIKVNQGK